MANRANGRHRVANMLSTACSREAAAMTGEVGTKEKETNDIYQAQWEVFQFTPTGRHAHWAICCQTDKGECG
jgi:hypothetical protein